MLSTAFTHARSDWLEHVVVMVPESFFGEFVQIIGQIALVWQYWSGGSSSTVEGRSIE